MPAAIGLITLGVMFIYSALKGIGITDVLAGVAGDTLNPAGGRGDVVAPAAGSGDTPGVTGGDWTAPGGGQHGFKGPHAADLDKLAGIATQNFKLTITATTNGGHVSGSYHYKGEAFDAGGAASDMEAFARFVMENYPHVSELIHNGRMGGYAIKDGKRVMGPVVYAAVWLGHRNHVHVAWG